MIIPKRSLSLWNDLRGHRIVGEYLPLRELSHLGESMITTRVPSGGYGEVISYVKKVSPMF